MGLVPEHTTHNQMNGSHSCIQELTSNEQNTHLSLYYFITLLSFLFITTVPRTIPELADDSVLIRNIKFGFYRVFLFTYCLKCWVHVRGFSPGVLVPTCKYQRTRIAIIRISPTH